MIVQQSGGGLSVQLPQVGGAQTNILGVGAQTGVVAIQGQNVTSTAQSGTVPQQQALPQQQAPCSLQQGSSVTQVTLIIFALTTSKYLLWQSLE